MVLLIIGIIFLIIGVILLLIAGKTKIQKNKEQENYNNLIKQQLNNLEKQEKELTDKVNQLQLKKEQLITFQIEKEKEIDNSLSEWKVKRIHEIQDYVNTEQQLAQKRVASMMDVAQEKIDVINEDFQNFQASTAQQKEQIQAEIDKLKASLSAGVQARLRELEAKDKISFYKLSLTDNNLEDVKILENLKPSLHNPVVLSKLIWSQYFQKQMTELCDRVLGKKTVCGIYKITNLQTEECYIGQSVDCASRWKQHCKCGLGIDASATNVLYNSMQKYGVWNFSFELLEECSKDLLNEKEAFWIDTYSSNIYGLNTMKGIKK